jgi:gamma-glutamyltranspeptidase/glutathione hydrolase
LRHNSAGYVHLVAEALNLAFADREAYVGDPRFVSVPSERLLQADYAAGQRARIRTDACFGRMPEPGVALPTAPPNRSEPAASIGKVGMSPDTIYACAMDKFGNAYSATLSDTTYDSPVIPGTGLVLSTRGHQSRLQQDHPASVAPGKRPRLTPSPAMALRDGRPWLCFGTPGGDVQSQAMLQVFLNIAEFGMQVQQAVEAPRFSSANFPNSFAPHDYYPGRLCIEANMSPEVVPALRQLGHDVQEIAALPPMSGAVCAVMRDQRTGLLHAGADPRREAYALAW